MPWIVPLRHPSALRWGKMTAEKRAQKIFVQRALEVTQGNPQTLAMVSLDTSTVPPEGRIRPTLETLRTFTQKIPEFTHLSIDIENAGHFITVLGFTLFTDLEIGDTVVVPFRSQHGINYWEDFKEHREAVEIIYGWLSDPRTVKVFHNGISHDVPLLEETGFEVNGPVEDTMVMKHYTRPEERKGLQRCATQLVGIPPWKHLLDEEDEDDGKG